MAVRNILTDEDPLLRKISREVSSIDERTTELVQDMIETLHDTGNGIGLAAPQVGVLRRIFIIDLYDENGTMVFINPEIIKTQGEQCNQEGCLSIPGLWGDVIRPEKVTVRAQGLDGEYFEMEADGILATCICHENDHLNGVLFTDKVEGELISQ